MKEINVESLAAVHTHTHNYKLLNKKRNEVMSYGVASLGKEI